MKRLTLNRLSIFFSMIIEIILCSSITPSAFARNTLLAAAEPTTATLGAADITQISATTTFGADSTFTTLPNQGQVNLIAYVPSGWSDAIVLSNVTGTSSDDLSIYNDQDIFLDWAVINNGTEDVLYRFYTALLVDGIEIYRWYSDPPLNINYYNYVLDFNLGKLSAGEHVVTIFADATDALFESNESDNMYSKNIYISSRGVSTTGTATGITKTSATLNGLVNPEGISTAVRFEYGQTNSYGNTVTADQSPVNGYDIINVTSNITGLAPYTLYHFRVVADNSYGTSYGGDSTFVTLSDQAAASTSIATAISQSAATLNGIVNPNGLSTTVQFEYGTTAGYGSIVTASQSPVNGNVGVNVSADITGLTANTLYHFRIKASNAASTTYGADLTFKTKFFYPASFNLSQNYSFGDPSLSSSYKLIGLPGKVNSSLTEFLTGTLKQDWDAYYDNGSSSNYLVEFDNSSVFQFNPGNGFWVISKNQLTISRSVNTVTLSNDKFYSVPLHSGWNIISNPFENSVIWDSVISVNSLNTNSFIYAWNAGWSALHSFDPYDGYYFYNQLNMSSLKIPYNPDGTIGKKIVETEYFINDKISHSLKLSLNLGDEEKSFVVVSIDSSSSSDFDEKDILLPPSDFLDAGITIHNNNLSIDYKYLLKESRPEIGNGQIFYLNVTNKQGNKLKLKSEGANSFNKNEVYLLDKYNSRLFNLKSSSNINLSPVDKTEYQILIGSIEFIKSKEKEIFPAEYKLYQNYPNPFNPVTTIEFSIPKINSVELDVYDILGRKAASLINSNCTPGYYRIEFNASNLPSGIYIYRLKAGSFVDSKKLLLIK